MSAGNRTRLPRVRALPAHRLWFGPEKVLSSLLGHRNGCAWAVPMHVRSGVIAQSYVPWIGVTGYTVRVPGMQRLQPGQYMLCASSALSWQVLPDVCVPTAHDAVTGTVDILITDGTAAIRWEIMAKSSMPLTVTAPLGKGFTFDTRVRRALLVDYGSPAAPLLFLARNLVEGGVEVVYLAGRALESCPVPASALPPEIEYRPVDDESRGSGDVLRAVDELSQWPDAVFLSGSRSRLLDVATLLRRKLLRLRRGFAQAVVSPDTLPCGVGACGLCAIETRSGTRRLCRDGLVFDLLDLA